MSAVAFSPLEAVRFSWNTLKGNFLFFLLLAAAISAAIYLPAVVKSPSAQLSHRLIAIAFPLGLDGAKLFAIGFALLAASAVEIVLLKVALGFYDHMGMGRSDLLRGLAALPSYLISSAVFLLIVALGLIFLILPGVYLFLKYQFYGYFIADGRAGPFGALKHSARITDGQKRRLLAFWSVLWTAILALSAILAASIYIAAVFAVESVPAAFIPMFYRGLNQALLISVLVIFIPMTKLGTAYIYRTLERQERATFVRSGSGRRGLSKKRFGKL